MSALDVRNGFSYLVDCILELKGRYRDPFIAISGDFNGYDVASFLSDYPDLVLLETSPTRGDRHLDLLFTNFNEHIAESGVLSPIESDSGVPSDHRVVHCSVELQRFEAFEWIMYSYMKQTNEGNLKFPGQTRRVERH